MCLEENPYLEKSQMKFGVLKFEIKEKLPLQKKLKKTIERKINFHLLSNMRI